VRQSAQRRSIPPVLEPDEVQCLLARLDNPFRVMVLLDVTTGLRRSELFALQWKDIDFSNLLIDIKRSIFLGVVGKGKSETARQPVPLSINVAADLWLWKETTGYSDSNDWVFASPRTRGKRPLRPDGVLSKIIRRAAVRAGIKKKIGWHTFRHTYSSTLIANGENVKVVQELMRHASSRFTLEVYTQAKVKAKREAQQQIVEMMLPDEGLVEIRLQRKDPPEILVDAQQLKTRLRWQMVSFGATENACRTAKSLKRLNSIQSFESWDFFRPLSKRPRKLLFIRGLSTCKICEISLADYFAALRTATPGSSLPSIHSRKAPPAVET